MSEKFKILVIGKQKHDKGLSIITIRQIKSLIQQSEKRSDRHYNFVQLGLINYMRSFWYLKKMIKDEKPALIHAHYSLVGMLSILARKREKTIVSFMGSDVYQKGLPFKFARYFVTKKADHIIVKSERLKSKFATTQNITVIPNGVDMELFQPKDKTVERSKLNWDQNKIHVLFPAGKNRYEKHFPLAKLAIDSLNDKDLELHVLENIDPEMVPNYLNAADIIVLTSRWEGSSNITKEAMACNKVVVSTKVGDADHLFKNTPGYFISEHNSHDVANCLREAILFIRNQQNPEGRKRLNELALDDASVANKILDLYDYLLEKS